MAWLTGWLCRKELTVQDTNVDGNLTDFPVYVKINADADFHEARADGFDIRFTQSDGETLLKYEREYWTGGNGSAATAHFWVKVPSILASGGATIYIYYGKADAGDGEDAQNVWDANFKGVWHMIDDPDNTKVQDSTVNNNEGAKEDANEPIEAAGKIWKGQDFDGGDDYIGIVNDLSLVFTGGDITLSFWVNADVFLANDPTMVFGESAFTGFANYLVYFSKDTGKAAWGMYNGIWGPEAKQNTVLNIDTWYFLTVVFTNSDQTARWYLNGIADGSGVTGIAIGDYPGTVIRMGSRFVGTQKFLNGTLDEMRISDAPRSANWIKFEYHNMQEADQELTWGAEEEEAVDYTLTADAGTYLLTGQVIDPLFGRLISMGAGSYSLAGQIARLLKDWKIGIGIESYILAGQDTALSKGRKLSADAGSYLMTGQIADLLRDAKIDIGVGSYALAGQLTDLLKDSIIVIGTDAYVLAGQDANLYLIQAFTSEIILNSLINIGDIELKSRINNEVLLNSKIKR